MIEILARWNRWGTARLPGGCARDVTRVLEPFLETPEVVALLGPRRAGKTTVLFQVMDRLEARGVPAEACLHINLEEPGLAPELSPALLDRLYGVWRERVCPTGRGYLFLDEIQHVEGWERWVRARTETEDIKVFLTGSSSALMSREMGTLLTGRQATFQVRPVSFSELLRFRGIEPPARPDLVDAAPALRQALHGYLRWGGFPEIVLAEDDRRRELLLEQYFDDVLFKDVAMRHSIRDLTTLRSLAVHLLTQTASLMSAQRVAGVFGVSADLGQAYCAYLEEAFLVEILPFASLKVAERVRRPRKVHAVDVGLRNRVCVTGSPDEGRLVETLVHGVLSSERYDELAYWKGSGEVDFVVRRGNDVVELVQVTAGEGAAIPPREVAALEEAGAAFPRARRTLVFGPASGPSTSVSAPGVDVVPLWRFLLTRGSGQGG